LFWALKHLDNNLYYRVLSRFCLFLL